MLAGTGEGPELALALLQRGWRLRVSVVTAAAAHVYRPLLQGFSAGVLQLVVGPLQGMQGITAQLLLSKQQGQPVLAVIDATHPFAMRVRVDLALACRDLQVPLLRVERVPLPLGRATQLPELGALAAQDLAGERLLLALGSRHLAAAMALSPGALHHARVLPSPVALQLALAAGLEPARIACLRPSDTFAVEEGLLRRWQIATILCRQSGGITEAGWRRLADRCGCRLLLVARPQLQADHPCPTISENTVLSHQALLAKLEQLAGPWRGGRSDAT